MHNPLRRTVFASLLVGLAAGCGNLGKVPEQPGAATARDHAKAPDLGKQRLMLSEGYSMLYQDAGNLDSSELILYVKVESEAMHKVVTEVADAGGQTKKDLERIAKN